MKKMKLLFLGAYGISSLGDDAMMVALKEGLENRGHEVEVTALCRHKKDSIDYYNKYGVSLLRNLDHDRKPKVPSRFRGFNTGDDRSHLKEINDSIAASDLVVLGGGDAFIDYLSGMFSSPLAYIRMILTLALFNNKPIVLAGISVVPIDTQIGRDTAAFICDVANKIILRDTASIDVLKDYNICADSNRTLILPDAVVGLKKREVLSEDLLCKLKQAQEKPCVIGVSVRSLYWEDEKEDAVIFENFAKVLDKAVDDLNASIVFIPQCTYDKDDPKKDDRNVANKVIELMKNKTNAISLNKHYCVKDVLKFYSECDYVLGMRHHSIVFSSIAATPCMALSYSDKVKNYMHDLSMDKYICDVRTNSSEEVYSTFKELVSSAHEVREHLKEAQKSNLIKWQKYLDTIEELI